MNRLYIASVVAVIAAVMGFGQALAAPPTVTPSPGYDARLQEQRKATSVSPPVVYQPAPPVSPVPRHHTRRKR